MTVAMTVGVAVPMAGGVSVSGVGTVPGSVGPTAVTRHVVPRIRAVPVRLT